MEKQQQSFSHYPTNSSSAPPSSYCFGDDQSSKNLCGFITHVQSATLLIGAAGSLTGSVVLAALLKAGAGPDQCVLVGMILCSYALLVLGWSARVPCFYWPFLLLNPLVMCLAAVFCTYPALDTLLAPIVFPAAHPSDFTRPSSSKRQLLEQVTRSLRMMEFVSSLCAILLLAYFQSIVFRAHNWQRKQNKLDEQLVIIGDQTP